MERKTNLLVLCAVAVVFLGGCSPKIYGRIQLVDPSMKPIEGEEMQGTVVNMINTTTSLEKASYSVAVDEKGEFESEKGAITPGIYKVEVTRIGYATSTSTVKIGSYTREKLEFKLKKIPEAKRRSIEASQSDEDKIINPGEVNIRPPMM